MSKGTTAMAAQGSMRRAHLLPLPVTMPHARGSPESLSISMAAAPSRRNILQRGPKAVQATANVCAASLPFCREAEQYREDDHAIKELRVA